MPKGYAIADTNKWTDFKVIDFDLKTPEDDDVDVDIQFCGVCVSFPCAWTMLCKYRLTY